MNTWPLGINDEMDEHAKARGLSHWSCTSPMSNDTWMRQDGEVFKPPFRNIGGYPEELREFDKKHPIGKSVVEEVKFVERCTIPGDGWICTRDGGHRGPCAVRPRIDLPDLTKSDDKWMWICVTVVGSMFVICYTIALIFGRTF